MPLAATHMPVVLDDRRSAVGVWMTVRPVQPIRVFVTYEALAQIEPSQTWDRSLSSRQRQRSRALRFRTYWLTSGLGPRCACVWSATAAPRRAG
jgi:hypothetical protein